MICEVELFEDDEHGGEVRVYRAYGHYGYEGDRYLCEHHYSAQQEMGADLRDDLGNGAHPASKPGA